MGSTSGLPAGIITCVFTDIEGSTRLLRELGPVFHDVLAVHDAVLREVWRTHDGHEVKTLGDSFLLAFERAQDAVAAAVAAQRAIGAADWPTELPIRIRIGMHTGYARPTNDDYTAMVVNQAARVVGAARGGQVLVTEQTASEVIDGGGHPGVHLVSLGRFRVRDFDEPVALHAAIGPGVETVDAPPRVRPADGHNLVAPTTSLVGRVDDLSRLGQALRPGRVTTLVGPGGVGKTRLATEAALAVAREWDDGAWFVDLAPVGDPALVAETIGDALGAPKVPGQARWPAVLAHLEEQHALIVLDNCEHLLASVGRAAAELVAGCPRVGVLATSRMPLGLLRDEQVQRVAPLTSAGATAPAVELFLARMSDPAAADLQAVAALCAALDGLPLAIELAAARTTAVTPAAILERLQRTSSVVRSRDLTLPERHRSLTRLLDYSWELLSPEARTVLERLSVFAAGFDVDGAEAVAAGGTVECDDVAEALWELIDASLVGPEEGVGATRYRLLTTVRAHAAARAADEDLRSARRGLAAVLLERVGPAHAGRRAWVVEMELELDNVRAAAAHVDLPAEGQALAWSIARFHFDTDGLRAGIDELERELLRRDHVGPERVGLLATLADLQLSLGRMEDAERPLAEAARLAARVGVPPWDDAAIVRTRGEQTLRRGDPSRAVQEARSALMLPCSPRARARLLSLLGCAAAAAGDLDTAIGAFEDELEAETIAGAETFWAATHGNLAEVHLQRGDESSAARHQAISLGFAREQGQPVLIAFSMMIAARLVARDDGMREAVVLQAKADELLRRAGQALYAEDARVRASLLGEAAARLGADAYVQAVASAAALAPEEVADLAQEVLTAVGSRSISERGA